MIDNIILILKKKFEGREIVAKHPKTGLYYGIDGVLRCPVTSGFKKILDAKKAYRDYMARAVAITADSISSLKRGA